MKQNANNYESPAIEALEIEIESTILTDSGPDDMDRDW